MRGDAEPPEGQHIMLGISGNDETIIVAGIILSKQFSISARNLELIIGRKTLFIYDDSKPVWLHACKVVFDRLLGYIPVLEIDEEHDVLAVFNNESDIMMLKLGMDRG
jgi:hypothetical protein